jgi:hypothetical protein
MMVIKDEDKASDRIARIIVVLFLAVADIGRGVGGQAQHLLILEGT